MATTAELFTILVTACAFAGDKPVLYYLCERGEPDDVDLVELILRNFTRPDSHIYEGKTPLYAASSGGHVGIVKLLLKKGSEPNKKTTDFGDTPLVIAIKKYHTGVVKLLLENGADANQKPLDGDAPLTTAAIQNGNIDVMKLLLEHSADPNKATIDGTTGYTPLIMAVSRGRTEVVKLLIKHGVDVDKGTIHRGITPLIMASSWGRVDVVKLLLQHRAKVDKATTDHGTTPLYAASNCRNINVAKLLLENGADPNRGDDEGETPLFSACQKGYIDVMQFLLENGADPNKQDEEGTTPLMIAIESHNDKIALELGKLLTSFGADIHYVSEDREDVFDIAQRDDKTETRAWLESVSDFTPIQICAASGCPAGLRVLVHQRELDPFAQGPDTPSLIELVGGKSAALLRLCREVQMKWAPRRHHLFHPAFRSTVKLLFLIRSCAPNRGLAGLWIKEIPTEIWIAIASQMKRVSWPKLGREALSF